MLGIAAGMVALSAVAVSFLTPDEEHMRDDAASHALRGATVASVFWGHAIWRYRRCWGMSRSDV